MSFQLNGYFTERELFIIRLHFMQKGIFYSIHLHLEYLENMNPDRSMVDMF